MSGGSLSAGTVSLGVKGDASGFGKKLSDDIKGQGAIFSSLGKHVGGLIVGGLGLAGIGLSIGAVFKTGFDEASDASAGIAQLAAGIKSTGNAANVSVKGMSDLASSIQDMSGQTDDSIVKAEQLLLTFTNIKNSGPNKIFDQATQAAADMAAKMGGDASSNAILLGKALNDPVKGVTALTRVGVSFTQGQKDSIAAMVKTGNTVGAQKVILKELQTEFGGAAQAAGQTLPGMLDRGKRAFEDLSQSAVETLLPIVQPAIAGVADVLKKASPFITEFAAGVGEKITDAVRVAGPIISGLVSDVRNLVTGFQDGTGAGGEIRTVLTEIYNDGVKPLADFVIATVVPAVQNLVTGFRDGTGAGGSLRDAAEKIYSEGLVPLADFITGTALPDLKMIEDWIVGPGVSALGSFVDWVGRSKQAIADTAAVIAALLLPVFADMTVKAVVSAATQVAAWVSTQVAAVQSSVAQFAAHYRAVAGWVMSAGAAIASGAETVAIWAMIQADSIAAAAKVVGAHLAVVGGWISSAASAIASGATQVGVWIAQGVQAGIGAAKVIGSLLVVAGGWIASAATATASGIVMAAAWVIGLGPIAWIIAAVVAIGAALVLAYNKVSWFHDAVDEAWSGIKTAIAAVSDWLGNTLWPFLKLLWAGVMYDVNMVGSVFSSVWSGIKTGAEFVWNILQTVFAWSPLGLVIDNWGAITGFFSDLPGKIGAAASGMWDGIVSAFKSAINTVIHLWNDFHLTLGGGSILGMDIPSVTLDTPDIPLLADGGIVPATPGGRLVRVAEAGQAEAIIPLPKNEPNGKPGVGDTYNIYEATSAEATANEVARRMAKLGR